jgi:polysaccharide biosynthesis/export protein
MKQKHQMRSSSFLLKNLLVLWACVLVVAGCGGGVSPKQTMALISPQSSSTTANASEINSALAAAALQSSGTPADYQLAPEDLLEITLYNIPESEARITPRKTEVRISQEGMITLPLVGDVRAAGLTTLALEQSLRQRYDKYLRSPQVGVMVKEYRGQQVTVTGAVKNPGMFQLAGPKTVIDLLSMAGGISERAGSQVHLYRQGPEGRQSYIIDLPALARNPSLVNMPVQPGDVMSVPLSGMFFVDGAVGSPGSYPLTQAYTLTQALAIAGGASVSPPNNIANTKEVSIFRRGDGLQAEKITVNLNDIRDGKVDDPQIAPDDVIVVPISMAKYIVERFLGKIGLPGFPSF